MLRGREELDHGSQGSLGTQDRTAIFAVLRWVAKSVGIFPREQFVHSLEVGFVIRDIDWAVNDGIRDRFGDFGFTATRDCARLVAKGRISAHAGKPPSAPAVVFDKGEPIARRPYVDMIGKQLERVLHAVDMSPAQTQIR